MLHGSTSGLAYAWTIIRTQGTGLAKKELIRVESQIDEITPDGRFGVTLSNEHKIIAYMAGKITPYDLTEGRISYRRETPGLGSSRIRGRITRN